MKLNVPNISKIRNYVSYYRKELKLNSNEILPIKEQKIKSLFNDDIDDDIGFCFGIKFDYDGQPILADGTYMSGHFSQIAFMLTNYDEEIDYSHFYKYLHEILVKVKISFNPSYLYILDDLMKALAESICFDKFKLVSDPKSQRLYLILNLKLQAKENNKK